VEKDILFPLTLHITTSNGADEQENSRSASTTSGKRLEDTGSWHWTLKPTMQRNLI
jgi:hypothetical protein